MTKIHGMVYIIMGIIVLSVSWFVKRDKLVVFIYASFIMIAMGVVKLVFSAKKEQLHSRHAVENKTNAVPTSSAISHARASRQHGINKTFNKAVAAETSPEIRKCLRCTNILNGNDRFCSRCGARAVR